MLLKELVQQIKFRQVISSRATPTVEVEFVLKGMSIFSSFPTGKSKGSLEAKVIEDAQDSKQKQYGKLSHLQIVEKTIEAHKAYCEILLNTEITSSALFDAYLIALDGTRDKSNIGANFLLPLSVCYCKLHAYIHNVYLWEHFLSYNHRSTVDINRVRIPLAHFNLLNGGMHSGNDLVCQEIMLCFERSTFKEQLLDAISFYQVLGEKISSLYGKIALSVGDEGGYAPPITTLNEALVLITSTAREQDFHEYKIALDMAANSFFRKGNYHIDGMIHTGEELCKYYEDIINRFPVYSIEDPFAENDYDAWMRFYKTVGERINVVADDLTVSNVELIEQYGRMGMFNTVLVKPSQVGTILESHKAVQKCRELGLKVMCSHRSGETEDTFITEFAVGMQTEYLKAGAPCRGERTCKYNQLLRIEETVIERKEQKLRTVKE